MKIKRYNQFINESSNRAYPSLDELRDFFQLIKDESFDFLILCRYYDIIEDSYRSFDREVSEAKYEFKGYTILSKISKDKYTKEQITSEIEHCIDNIKVYYPTLNIKIGIQKDPPENDIDHWNIGVYINSESNEGISESNVKRYNKFY